MSWQDQIGFPVLSVITFLPLAGVVLILAIDLLRRPAARLGADGAVEGAVARQTWWPTTYKVISLATTLAAFALTVWVLFVFDKSASQLQFVEDVMWVRRFNIHYSLGIDGIAALMLLLTTLLGFIVIIGSWHYIKDREMGFFVSLLLLQTGMTGVFCATDLVLFYVFWEAMLVPMYFIIGVWGGPRKIYAAIKFVLFTLVGSLLMLVAIVAVVWYVNGQGAGLTFDIRALSDVVYPYHLQFWAFLAFFLAFAIKVPMFPLHTWLPDAHVEAPTAGSVILAGVLLKMGAYGMLRFCLPFFPDAAVDFVPLVAGLSVVAIIYGAAVSLVQKDLKKLIAYSSVSHMGFVTAGIFAAIAVADNAAGMEGAVLVMFNHGVLTGALFLMVGYLYERTHTRQIAEMSMLATPLPVFAGFFLFFTLGSLGLPGLNGFVGEFLSLLGLFEYSHALAAIGALGIILAACYLLWMYQRTMFNDRGEAGVMPAVSLRDISPREIVSLLPLVVLAVWIGVYPNTFLDFLHTPVQYILQQMGPSIESARDGAVAHLIEATKGLF
ncbi:MAG TPA: NADH-quinone oxidoreductase subunit M [Thermoleophilia bacterium]|nr:NADH-quinone oxidoreductase subunit M [Thermoleophilia bacterium]